MVKSTIPVKSVCLAALCMLVLSATTQAQELTGREFNALIYSDFVEEPSTTIVFEEGGTLLIDAFNGFGLYVSAGSVFTASFSAPDFKEKDDLLLMLSGAAVGEFIAGGGIALKNMSFYTLFYFLGYAL